MAHKSGKTGTLTVDATAQPITDWNLSTKTELGKFATSASSGWKTGVPGTRDSSGTFNMKANAAPPDQDDTVEIVMGHENFATAVAVTYTVPAVITQVDVLVNVDTGEAIGYAVSWEGIGPVVRAVAS